jgi:hypothetical protein
MKTYSYWCGAANVVLAISVASAASSDAAPRPCIFWASDPVRPDETVLLQGSDFPAAAVVEITRLDNTPTGAGADGALPARDAQLGQIKAWTRVPVLQGTDETLKFVVPADWAPGVFACRIVAAGAASEPTLLNEPDPWWIQGDEGEAATAGGWLRVLGKSLTTPDPAGKEPSTVRLERDGQAAIVLPAVAADGYSLRCAMPADLAVGKYRVHVSNGSGGPAAWSPAGTVEIIAAPKLPAETFSVLAAYGPDAVKAMRNSLVKYNLPVDRTEGIKAALQKAKENGGGTVFFPAGRYTIKGPLVIPDRTMLKGEGMGLVTLWWGEGHFNLDGGGQQGRAKVEAPKPPDMLIFGQDYGLEDLSIYLPLAYEQGIVADKRLRMQRVRVRVDHSWLPDRNGEGTVARMGRNFQVTDCDIYAKGQALVSGDYGLIANNRILAGKTNTPLGGAWGVIVENNQFVGMDPTAYQNIAGCGRNIYYAHNRQESLFVHQADYSFTFDASAGAYLGGIAQTQGTDVTLAADPVYPDWAREESSLWRRSVVCVLSGRGAGQWRDVRGNRGRNWKIDRPFDTAPDATSVVSIIPFSGRVLIVGNRFEDAAWVNAGYGTSIDVICAENDVVRSALLMNLGVHADDWFEPSWYVQYFDNRVTEGQTGIESNGGGQKSDRYSGPLTCWAVHRRHTIAADNGGSISIAGNLRDVIVEGCTLNHSMSVIKADGAGQGVLLRNNHFFGSAEPRYEGDAAKNAVVLEKPQP